MTQPRARRAPGTPLTEAQIASIAGGASWIGHFGVDNVCGTNGDDLMIALDGDDNLEGRAGNDVIIAGGGDDTVKGESGDDMVAGGDGDDVLNGDSGDDTVGGGDGDDTIVGGTGDDTLDAGTGDDLALGGSGDDVLVWKPDGGHDVMMGDEGRDTLVVPAAVMKEGTFHFEPVSGAPLQRTVTEEVIDSRRVTVWSFAEPTYVSIATPDGAFLQAYAMERIVFRG